LPLVLHLFAAGTHEDLGVLDCLFFLQIVEVSDRRAAGGDYDDDHGGILLNPDPDLERGSSSHLRSLVIGGGD
jgi:hypothetical protein